MARSTLLKGDFVKSILSFLSTQTAAKWLGQPSIKIAIGACQFLSTQTAAKWLGQL
ncbi:hypothetical protein ACL6C3_25170 [Capilliphycus salinus ALCB114379]|uniref:hypothetical protein n=1 Tax=Capilliphycus salinus TaxID=2768948 RepID=UPI0039A6986B